MGSGACWMREVLGHGLNRAEAVSGESAAPHLMQGSAEGFQASAH